MTNVLNIIVSIVFHGLAYAMVLYVISVGLSLTMGMLNFVNLAHGVFAMAGGYAALWLMKAEGVPFILALVLSALLIALVSVILERLLYRRLYGAGELDQTLMTIGLIFMATAAAHFAFGPLPQRVDLPPAITGHFFIAGRDFPTYRAFLIVAGCLIFVALWLGIERTLVGARIRAAVDNRSMAQCIGINTSALFTIVFALGSGVAALGGGLGADIIAIAPGYAMEHLIYFLIVVSMGGLGSITGAFVAALILGIGDTACKILVPEVGAFFVYVAVFVVLLFRPAGLFGRTTS
jgi:branched-chain amino acid transport system permease protein